MTTEDARAAILAFWGDKAAESLQSAQSEFAAGRLTFAVNRAYYACFYSASALLLKDGRKFVKHSGVRAVLHRHLVKTGRVSTSWGRFYDRIFENRQRGDYQELVFFETEQVAEIIEKAREFVTEMSRLLTAGNP
jgi:uncharacterized protein (UPF0332 family)